MSAVDESYTVPNTRYAVLQYISFTSHSGTYCTFNLKFVEKILFILLVVTTFPYRFVLFVS